ncbi:MAG: HTTM domain-containing protein [Myxococcales bacterium]
MSALRAAWSRLFSEERDAYVLGLLRLALSALIFVHCGRLLLELQHNGYFADFFFVPIVPASWVPSRSAYELLLGGEAVAAACAFLGWWPREALLGASSIGLFVLLCDRLQYHNNRYALLILGWLLAFTPCDRSFRLARRPLRLPEAARIAPTFARRLFQVQVSLVYLGSAFGKLLDSDWRGGQVLLLRFLKTAEICAQHGFPLPAWLAQLFASALFASLAAKAAIATELFIAIGAWLPRTRRLALWVGVLFHFWIEVSARVELFSWLMWASYFAFVTPELRERRFEFDPDRAAGRALLRLVVLCDWCARFERAPLPFGERGRAFCYVTNRQGRRAHGLLGAAYLAEAIPLLFPLWLPFALVSRLRRSPVALG